MLALPPEVSLREEPASAGSVPEVPGREEPGSKQGGPEESGPESSAVPRRESARLQLALAQQAKLALVGTRGRERMDRRWEAAEAYRAVRVHFPGEACLGAEGSFRAGELLRGGGDFELALREFQHARELCPRGPFSARAVLEIGHLERRLGHTRAALDAYQELYAGAPVPASLRDAAMLWAGRVHQSAGQHEAAWRLWERTARGAEDPVNRVRAYDLLALALVEQRDLEGAAGMLERCRRALHEVAQEETRLGERVRSALVHMRVIATLRRSVAQRRGTLRIDGGEAE